jgi:hypothetical protein
MVLSKCRCAPFSNRASQKSKCSSSWLSSSRLSARARCVTAYRRLYGLTVLQVGDVRPQDSHSASLVARAGYRHLREGSRR